MQTSSSWTGLWGFIVGLVGVGVGLGGFAIAIWQIRELGARATKIRHAVEVDRRRTAAVVLASTAREMEAVAIRLQQALSADRREDARIALHDWRRVAVNAQSFARMAEVSEEALTEALETSLGLISDGLSDLGPEGAGAVVSTLTGTINSACSLAQSCASAKLLGET